MGSSKTTIFGTFSSYLFRSFRCKANIIIHRQPGNFERRLEISNNDILEAFKLKADYPTCLCRLSITMRTAEQKEFF